MNKSFLRLSVLLPVIFFSITGMLVISVFGGVEESVQASENSGAELSFYASGAENPSCLDNWENWNHSLVRNENAAWSFKDFPTATSSSLAEASKIQQFVDVNGDGLVDYVYAKRYPRMYYASNLAKSVAFTYANECVVLNNGNGWETAYRCYTKDTPNGVEYYGDCAG